MSQTYDQRRATVEHALAAEKINPGEGKTLSELAAKVLDALDHIKETRDNRRADNWEARRASRSGHHPPR
jgi:hypothetical protein